MSSDEVGAELVWRAQRGQRVLQIRGDLTGDDFADAINAKAEELRVPGVNYDKTKVSRLEAGGQATLPAEEAVIIALLDKKKRGVEWLVLGRNTKLPASARPALDTRKRPDERAG